MGFFQDLGVMILIILFSGAVGYWIFKLLSKFRYKIMPPKIEEDELRKLMAYAEANVDPVQLQKFLLLHGRSPKRTKEMLYLYDQVRKKLKGGVKK